MDRSMLDRWIKKEKTDRNNRKMTDGETNTRIVVSEHCFDANGW